MELVETVPWMGDLVVHRYRLENGLRVLLCPDPSAPVFTFNAWYDVGSRDEVEGRTGLAHLFEHLMFKETKNLAEGEFDKQMEARGASTNAGTYLDWTYYTESLKTEYLDFCLRLEADRMRHMILGDHQLETEREVVKNERLLRTENDPEGAMHEALYGAAYHAHPYRWPVIGRKPDLDVIDLNDCLEFYRTWYSPGNCIVVLVGDLDPEETMAMVEKHYGEIPAVELPDRQVPGEPAQRGERRVGMEKPISSEIVLLGYHVPRFTHEDLPALEVLSTILFDGPSSRVERRLIGDLQLATHVHSYVANTKDPGLWEVQITMREGQPAWRGEVVLYEAFDEVARDWVSEAELDKAKGKLEAGFLRHLRDSGDKAFQIGFHEIVAGDFRVVGELLDRYRRVTREDVRRVAAEYLTKENRTAVVASPRAAEGRAGVERGVHVKDLSGKARYYASTSPDLPMVSVRMVLRAGATADPEGRAGLTHLAAEMLLRGTRARGREDFEEAVDALGGRMGVNTGRLTTTLGGEVPARNLTPYLDLLFEVVTEPAFREEELQKLKIALGSELLELRNDDASLVDHFFRRHLFEEGAFGRDHRGTLPALATVNADQVRDHASSLRTRANLVVGLAGDLDAMERADEVDTYLHGLAPGEAWPLPEAPRFREGGRRLLLVDKPERSQVHYALGHAGIPASHEDWIPLLVAETAFGGTFTSTLMHELREKRGWTYGVYSGNARTRLPDAYMMVAYPGAEEAPECLRTHLDLYEAYCRGEFEEEALEAAKSYMTNRFPFVRDTVTKRLDRAMESEFLGTAPDYWDTYVERVQAVTLDQAREVVARHRRAEDLVGVVICTAEGFEERLEAAGVPFDQVEVVSYETAGMV